MGTPVLSDVQPATFGDVDFDAQVLEWTDTRKQRYALHEYPKKDGGEVEPLGRAPHRVRFQVVYVGANWRRDYMRLAAKIDNAPLDVLVHPLFGSMKAFCEGFEGAPVNVENAIDTVVVPVSFIESAVNTTLRQQDASPTAKAALIRVHLLNLSRVTQIYATVSFAVAKLNFAAGLFAAAIDDMAKGGPPNPALLSMFQGVADAAYAARVQIKKDPAYTDDGQAADSLTATEQVVSACAEADDALKATRPVLAPYTVPAQTSLLVLAQRHFRTNAVARMAEIQAYNPGKITNPAAIPAGTVLQIPNA